MSIIFIYGKVARLVHKDAAFGEPNPVVTSNFVPELYVVVAFEFPPIEPTTWPIATS